jgi:hypothetical protein
MMTFCRERLWFHPLAHTGRRAHLALMLVSLCAAGACTHNGPRTVADAPPLDVPAPPPRDVAPSDTEAPPPVSLVPEPAHNTPTLARPVREQPRADAPKPEPAKPEPAPSEPAKPAEEPPKPTVLQTAPTQVEGEVERGIRASLAKATNELNRVDYRSLNVDARTQYDTAKRFISTAEEAMRVKNLVMAKNLAEKAATLAAQLGGR